MSDEKVTGPMVSFRLTDEEAEWCDGTAMAASGDFHTVKRAEVVRGMFRRGVAAAKAELEQFRQSPAGKQNNNNNKAKTPKK